VPDDPYLDPATGILYNKLGITTAPALEAAEREITHITLSQLSVSPVPPTYDLSHLRVIHRAVFHPIYEWAGEIRMVAIAKSHYFCLPQFIEPYAADVFGALRKENCLHGLDRAAFVDRLTHYLGEVNAIHPFREGNGRTQRVFFEQLAGDAGFGIKWQRMDPAQNVEASIAIMRGDPAPMRAMLEELVSDAAGGR
jgi:cell filamentation protein